MEHPREGNITDTEETQMGRPPHAAVAPASDPEAPRAALRARVPTDPPPV